MSLKQFAIWIDQGFNVLLGGYADETLSARAWRLNHWSVSFINKIFFWEDHHCYNSYLAELHRRQLPPSYRK